jgi:hypothetical protein
MVRRAALELADCPALEIRFRQRARAFDQEVVGSGVYLQKHADQGLQQRLEIKLQVADRLSTILQVSDGRLLWLRREGPDGVSLGRIDLQELHAGVSESGSNQFSTMSAGLLDPGGLPRLLAGLEENFSFDTPVAARLASTPVWTVRGQWSPRALANLFPGDRERILAGELPDPSRLPRQMPTSVRLVLRQADLLPLRIDFGHPPSGAQENGEEPERARLEMEFYGLRRLESLDERLFEYEPGDQPVEDLTYRYRQRLGADAPDEN